MANEYIKIGKDNYRFFFSYSDKDKAIRAKDRLRKEGKLVRVIKKIYDFRVKTPKIHGSVVIHERPKEIFYEVYYCTSRRREPKWVK